MLPIRNRSPTEKPRHPNSARVASLDVTRPRQLLTRCALGYFHAVYEEQEAGDVAHVASELKVRQHGCGFKLQGVELGTGGMVKVPPVPLTSSTSRDIPVGLHYRLWGASRWW